MNQMRKWQLTRNTKAVSPVLSNLLLTIVAVAAMSIATSATYVISNNLRETMGERIIIEDLWFKPSTSEISVYLRNVGKVEVKISAVYINHTSQSFTSLSLRVGESGWLNITYGWTVNSLYHIDVVTVRGTHVADSYRAPSTP